MRCSIWAVHLFAFGDPHVTFYAGLELFTSIAISAEHAFFTSLASVFVAFSLIIVCNMHVYLWLKFWFYARFLVATTN